MPPMLLQAKREEIARVWYVLASAVIDGLSYVSQGAALVLFSLSILYSLLSKILLSFYPKPVHYL